MQDKFPKCAIVIPVYNEKKCVTKVIGEIISATTSLRHILKTEIICVNDGSTDESGRILNGIKQISVINNSVKQGYGASIKKGIGQTDADWIMIIDCDNTYPAGKIYHLVTTALQGYDMVIAERNGENFRNDFLRGIVRRLLTLAVLIKTGIFFRDINSGMRIFRRTLFVQYSSHLSNKFSFTTTLSYEMARNKFNIGRIQIIYGKRIGRSKMAFGDYFSILYLMFTIIFG
jgi:glycosyltransferase involved in cell wall biosynthesis